MIPSKDSMDTINSNEDKFMCLKSRFWDLIKEIFCFLLLCVTIASIIFGIFYVLYGLDWIFMNLMYIGGFFFYPCLLGVFILWIKVFKKRDFNEFMLGKPKFPEKGHRWFYYFWFGGWFTLLIVYIAMLLTNIAILQSEDPLFGISIFHGIFAAAIVEEIIFRGYLYARCEDIFGKNRHYIVWTRQEYDKEGISTERPFMTFEITYAALLSSFIFGIYHLNPIQLIITFFGGLFFCKIEMNGRV